jgi:hypothetical protein
MNAGHYPQHDQLLGVASTTFVNEILNLKSSNIVKTIFEVYNLIYSIFDLMTLKLNYFT